MNTPVNLSKVLTIFSGQVLQGIRYRLGGKAPSLNATPSQLEKGIDCSGEVRLLLFQGTDGELKIPDGSWLQREWCEKNLEEVPYSQAINAKPGELYIAFITAGVKGAGKIGHVWLIAQRDGDAIAETMESYGGHGIGSRPANTGVLMRLVHKCFRVPTTATVAKPAPTPAPKPIPERPPLKIFWNGNEFTLTELIERGGHTVTKTTEMLDGDMPRVWVNSVPNGAKK